MGKPYVWGPCECGRLPLLCDSCAAGWGDKEAATRVATRMREEIERAHAALKAEVEVNVQLRMDLRAQLAEARGIVEEAIAAIEYLDDNISPGAMRCHAAPDVLDRARAWLEGAK